jgi:transposase
VPGDKRALSAARCFLGQGAKNLEKSGKLAQLMGWRFPTVAGMDAIVIETLKQDVREGQVTADRLIELIALLQRTLQTVQQRLQASEQRCAELEQKLGGPPTTKLDQPYSMRAEEKRQEAAGKKPKAKRKKRGGRFRSRDKIAAAERTELVYPEGVRREECWLSHVRPVWRLENNRAVLIAYAIYRGPGSKYGQIPGVLGRSEFGLEIVTELAHLVYIVGLSFDKACALLHFFQNLQLSKGQANVLLYRLARHWERQFEVLCTLLANSLVVHADETRWSLNSVWALLSEKARVLLYGVHKDAETLRQILDPATFAGLVISDDAAVYESFTKVQKCWAHLLRKAIKLALQDPDRAEYRSFADGLLAIYREACRIQRDQRFSMAGRADKVAKLDDQVLSLCEAYSIEELLSAEGLEHDFGLLVAEVLRLMMNQALFRFVTEPPVQQPNGTIEPVSGTNNESERTLRTMAQARVTGRTNKTDNGTRRQTVLVSVLESLRLYLPIYTLGSVVEELQRWWVEGRSCFEKLLRQSKLKVNPKATPTIDRIFPVPSPEPSPSG